MRCAGRAGAMNFKTSPVLLVRRIGAFAAAIPQRY